MLKQITELKRGKVSPFSVVFWITSKCNSRCQTCNIWNNNNNTEMDITTFEECFKNNKILRDIKLISFSGGEPFLKEDIVEFAKIVYIYSKPMQVRFVTNGILSDKIEKDIKSILEITELRINVKISIDGTKETHNKIRGIDCYDKAIDTLNRLKKINNKKLSLTIGFTANKLNYKEIEDVFELARDNDVDFFYKPIMEADKLSTDRNDLFFDEYIDFKIFDYLIEFHKKLKLMKKRTLQEKIISNLYLDYLEKYYLEHKRIIPCFACKASFHVSENWDVITCSKLNRVIGNIKETPLNIVLDGEKAKEFRNNNKGCYCLCTADIIPSLIVHKFPFYTKL